MKPEVVKELKHLEKDILHYIRIRSIFETIKIGGGIRGFGMADVFGLIKQVYCNKGEFLILVHLYLDSAPTKRFNWTYLKISTQWSSTWWICNGSHDIRKMRYLTIAEKVLFLKNEEVDE